MVLRRLRLLLMMRVRVRKVRNLSLPVTVSVLPLAALNNASDGGASKSQDGKRCLLNHLETIKSVWEFRNESIREYQRMTFVLL